MSRQIRGPLDAQQAEQRNPTKENDMKAKIEIKMDNAAFGDDPNAELARILRELAEQAENGLRIRTLFDINGNRVGRFEISGGAS